MSRRSQRKRGTTGTAASGAADPKHVKVPPGVVWEWEGDGGKWNKYAPEHSQDVTDALTRGDNDVTLKVSSSIQMKVRFSAMTQMNVSTGWQRDIRCSPTGATKGKGGIWEWQDENGTWNGYSSPTQRLLEACRLCGADKTSIEVAGRQYTVDLKAMQQVNEETGVTRNVQRVDESSSPVWQWQDEHGVWRDYDSALCHKLEAAHDESGGGGGTVSFTAAGRSYTVDVGKMEQTNTATGVGRKVARRGPAVPPATAGSSAGGETSSATTPTASVPSPATTRVSKGEEAVDGQVIRTFQGKVPVDYACTHKIGKAHVYCEGGQFWDATLNQTNLRNNNNKFYILQLLEDSSPHSYSTWFRWGRVGKTGQHMLQECGTDLDQAKQHFTRKFHDKTMNQWEDRESFVKHPGKYDLLLMDYEAKDEPDVGEEEEEESSEVKPKSKALPESKLDKRVQALIELICNVQAMEDAVVEMKYDTKKAPLGKLTVEQIRLGYAALKKIEDCISRNHFGDQLVHACDEFYTRIPHNFGMRRPPLIRTGEEVKEKLQLIEVLGDIQIAMKILKGGGEGEQVNPIDRHYNRLKCQLLPLDKEDDTFRMMEKYVRQTHARTHNQYRMEVSEVFEVEREGEAENFMDVGNRHLLWHGSRLTNWVGILSQGLRIAPPEAPVTGYMFGKGVYFADMCSKSANYCFASRSKNDGLLILCDTALGKTNDLLVADYHADQLPKGKHSTRGLGRIAPNLAQNETLRDGCIVPLGTSIDTGVNNPHGYTLNYNEYVIYDTRQAKMRYLVLLKFHFK